MEPRKYLFTSESVTEGRPTYLSDYNKDMVMGSIISQKRKKSMLPFIKRNAGKMSQREMARRLGIGNTTINRWCTELGFHHVKHTVNENFFDELNENSVYVLGYIFADGNISWNPKKGYQALTITAAEKDNMHLEKVRKLISSSKPLLYSDKTKSNRLIVNNKKICQKLMKIGVVPRKSLIVKFPKIPGGYLRHFVRGVIDGDGTVRYVKRKRSSYFEIQISSGSPMFLKRLRNVIKKNVGVDAKMRKIDKNTFLVQYSCTRGEKLANWIYSNANLFLNRKHEQYKAALAAKGGGQP